MTSVGDLDNSENLSGIVGVDRQWPVILMNATAYCCGFLFIAIEYCYGNADQPNRTNTFRPDNDCFCGVQHFDHLLAQRLQSVKIFCPHTDISLCLRNVFADGLGVVCNRKTLKWKQKTKSYFQGNSQPKRSI